MFVDNTIDVEVRDIADSATISAIRQSVRNAFGHLVGTWHVRVSASDEFDRWDLRIRGGFGHYTARFLAAPDQLAARVQGQLRTFLRGVCPPLSIAPRRPVLVVRAERPLLRFSPPPPSRLLLKSAS